MGTRRGEWMGTEGEADEDGQTEHGGAVRGDGETMEANALRMKLLAF